MAPRQTNGYVLNVAHPRREALLDAQRFDPGVAEADHGASLISSVGSAAAALT